MTNTDSYYGTLFSPLSYGTGEYNSSAMDNPSTVNSIDATFALAAAVTASTNWQPHPFNLFGHQPLHLAAGVSYPNTLLHPVNNHGVNKQYITCPQPISALPSLEKLSPLSNSEYPSGTALYFDSTNPRPHIIDSSAFNNPDNIPSWSSVSETHYASMDRRVGNDLAEINGDFNDSMAHHSLNSHLNQPQSDLSCSTIHKNSTNYDSYLSPMCELLPNDFSNNTTIQNQPGQQNRTYLSHPHTESSESFPYSGYYSDNSSLFNTHSGTNFSEQLQTSNTTNMSHVQYHEREHRQYMLRELNQLSIGNEIRPALKHGSFAQQPKFEFTPTKSHWLQKRDLFHFTHISSDNQIQTIASSIDLRPSSGLVSHNFRSDQPVSTQTTKHKTWANIAGQPAKGSAAIHSTPVWASARRIPTSSYQTATNSPAPQLANAGLLPIQKHTSRITGQSSPTSIKDSSKSEYPDEASNQSLLNESIPVDTNGDHNAKMNIKLLHRELSKSINPKEFDIDIENARFFVIKSFSEDDIHRSIKYSIWCSTELGNKKLDTAFSQVDQVHPIYLFYSVNGSGYFCGMAKMTSRVDYNTRAGIWAQDKWQGQFSVRWIYVKDIPNTVLRQIRIETNDNKPVTHSRDTTELPLARGRQVLEIFSKYEHSSSIFDDFAFYEQRERHEDVRRKDVPGRNK